MITPRKPPDPSPEDDPTGVRALLSSMPEPEPMPVYLVERISASLAAEQARRSSTDRTVTALRTSGAQRGRRWGARLGIVLAGAATVAAIAVVGSSLLSRPLGTSADSTASGGAAFSTSGTSASPGAEALRDLGTASAGSGAASGAMRGQLDIQSSGTRYTSDALAAQARTLLARPLALHPAGSARPPGADPPASESPTAGAPAAGDARLRLGSVGPLGTDAGISACLRSVGVSLGARDTAIADVATYDGTPAVVIVTSQGATQVAYVVRPECSATNAALVTALPLP